MKTPDTPVPSGSFIFPIETAKDIDRFIDTLPEILLNNVSARLIRQLPYDKWYRDIDLEHSCSVMVTEIEFQVTAVSVSDENGNPYYFLWKKQSNGLMLFSWQLHSALNIWFGFTQE